MQNVITDDLEALFGILPPHICQPLCLQHDISELLEVILDLGRLPEARFPQREVVLNSTEVSEADIDYVTTRVSDFGGDNRAGIERTLHRISAIRNRKECIVGLTCRVGRAVFGTIKIIEDLIQLGKNILLLGRPGIGKTTILREVARVLADDFNKRVIIVDTSNEIAGDGDIPHPAIGHARRMQVTTPTEQHAVMIEAVENHMPEVIIIDEIGTELQALGARTIAERGVQLVGTAHGNTLENLMMNPTLADLIGGIQTVTLGDEEAKRRGTQKSILERKSPPTFDIVVEIWKRDKVVIHSGVSEAIDAILKGQPIETETRYLDEKGEVGIEKEVSVSHTPRVIMGKQKVGGNKSPWLYLFGVNRGRLEQIAREIKVSLNIVNNLKETTLLVTSKSYYRRKPQIIKDAETMGLPIYVLRSNTPPQIKHLLNTLYSSSGDDEPDFFQHALAEAEAAARQVHEEQGIVELSPQSAYIRRLQHLIAEQHKLLSGSLGREPNRKVRFYQKEAMV
ncbi:R3H domain-containing nucleic acid-binding protein [Chloroflexota bacterium]